VAHKQQAENVARLGQEIPRICHDTPHARKFAYRCVDVAISSSLLPSNIICAFADQMIVFPQYIAG
jgi:hypothetical protein